jgi:hypothetical protein
VTDEGSLNPEVRGDLPGPIPGFLDRRPVCAVCKEPEPPPNRVGVDDLTVWLHPGGCEDEYQRRLDAKSHPGNGGLAEMKPWSTPTVEEVPIESLPTELRMMALGLADREPEAAAEKAPPAADVIDEAEKAKQEAATEKQPVEKAPPAQPDQPVSAPDPVPTRPMLPGDRRRAEIRARNQEALRRTEAAMKAQASGLT